MDDLTALLQAILDESKLKETEHSVQELHKLASSLKKQLSQAAESFTQWLSVNSAVMFGISKAKEAVSELIEIDSILTEIGRTSGLSAGQLQELGDSAFESASKYGRSAADYLTGVQEMYQAGFDNAGEMAELSLLAQAAGGMTADSANNFLTAANAAYELKGNTEALNRMLDSQSYIAANTAVSMQDMADATAESAAAAAHCGVEMEELSALAAAVLSKTGASGTEVGAALKDLFAALQDTTGESAARALHSVGISMTEMIDGAERLKAPVELLKELSDAYNKLPEGGTGRTDLLSDLGMEAHIGPLSAVLSDWEACESMLDLYSRGAGSAAREAEKSAGSMEASLARLGNTWTDTIGNIADSDAIIGTVNALNGLLSIINNVTDKLGPLGTISTIGAGYAGANGLGLTDYVTVMS